MSDKYVPATVKGDLAERILVPTPNETPEGTKTKLKVKIAEPYEHLASKVRDHNKQDTGDLPELLDALSRVGEFKNIKVKGVTAIDQTGNMVAMTEPTDAVLIGESGVDETYRFLTHYVTSKILPPEFRGEPTRDKDKIRKVWTEMKPVFDQIILEAERAILALKVQYEQQSFQSGGQNGLDDFKAGKGSVYEDNFLSARKKIQQETIERLKMLAAQTSEQMK